MNTDFIGFRRVVQVTSILDTTFEFPQLIALCEDGTIWKRDIRTLRDETGNFWKNVSGIPKPPMSRIDEPMPYEKIR